MSATTEYIRKNGADALNSPATIGLVLSTADRAIEKITAMKERIEALEKAVGVDTATVTRRFRTTKKKT